MNLQLWSLPVMWSQRLLAVASQDTPTSPCQDFHLLQMMHIELLVITLWDHTCTCDLMSSDMYMLPWWAHVKGWPNYWPTAIEIILPLALWYLPANYWGNVTLSADGHDNVAGSCWMKNDEMSDSPYFAAVVWIQWSRSANWCKIFDCTSMP